MIVTPGQLTNRAEFYHQLAQLAGAGVGLVQALEMLERNPPSRSYRAPIRRVHDYLGQGCTFTEAIEREGGWLPQFDTALVRAGEHSGRLDVCFRLLADYYTDRARIARQVIGNLAYPAFLLHFAVFILPFPQFFLSGDVGLYLRQTLSVLVPLYVLLALLILAMQGKHGETWRGWVESVLNLVPLLGTGRRYLALSRLAAALEALIGAGIGIIEAWDLAATASGSPGLRREVADRIPQFRGGERPSEIVRASSKFPGLFADQYQTGEATGKLEEALGRLRRFYQEEGWRKLQTVAQWAPRVIYLVIMLAIAYRVISFYLNYYQQVGQVMQGF